VSIRAAVIGAGLVGTIHARALAAHPDIELVGICARTPHRAAGLAAAHRVPVFLGVNELLGRAAPDLVCVATGNDEHAGPAIAALRAGVHVLCEKPLAFSLEQADAIVGTADESGAVLGVNFNHRFSEPFRRAIEFVRDGELGPAAYVAVRFAGDLYKELPDPLCMLKETQGHSFDLLRLFGGEIAEVTAMLSDPRNIGVWTSASISVRFQTGAIGNVLGSWDSSYAHPHGQMFEYRAAGGGVIVDNVIDAVRLFRHDDPEYREWRPGLFDGDRRDFWRTIDAHVAAFVDAVRDGKPAPVSGLDGRRALELSLAAGRSFQEGRAVSV
jgi:predicted dehydrogenase